MLLAYWEHFGNRIRENYTVIPLQDADRCRFVHRILVSPLVRFSGGPMSFLIFVTPLDRSAFFTVPCSSIVDETINHTDIGAIQREPKRSQPVLF